MAGVGDKPNFEPSGETGPMKGIMARCVHLKITQKDELFKDAIRNVFTLSKSHMLDLTTFDSWKSFLQKTSPEGFGTVALSSVLLPCYCLCSLGLWRTMVPTETSTWIWMLMQGGHLDLLNLCSLG